tara:strand:+ start:3600 stop:4307 length:708 start_codon:yes stop_codon:yes gene_type:complete
MEKNKTAKYFKYAIGEIVLVVIGILIALQVSNWNTQRNDKKWLTSVLSDIKIDLQKDTIGFSNIIKKIPNLIDNARLSLNRTEFDSVSANFLLGEFPDTYYPYSIQNQAFQKILDARVTNFFELDSIYKKINVYYTIGLNGYNEIKGWDKNGTLEDGKFFASMGIEDAFTSLKNIRLVQSEAIRKKIFIEQINSPQLRNILRENIYRKKRFKNTVTNMKLAATRILKNIDEILEE